MKFCLAISALWIVSCTTTPETITNVAVTDGVVVVDVSISDTSGTDSARVDVVASDVVAGDVASGDVANADGVQTDVVGVDTSTFDAKDSDTDSGMGAVCDKACAELKSESDAAICYSCRCKKGLGMLPNQADLQCVNAQILVIDHAAGGKCANPSLLYGVCVEGSRLGQKTVGDVHFKWLCRHNKPQTKLALESAETVYDDVGIIAHNRKTGAACFWDDEQGTTNGTNLPTLDLTAGVTLDVDNYLAHFDNQNHWSVTHNIVNPAPEEHCASACHDSDPFSYTPFLKSAWDWSASAGYTQAPYKPVTLTDERVIPRFVLASKEVSACTSCHKLGWQTLCAETNLNEKGQPGVVGVGRDALGLFKSHAFGVPTGAPANVGYWMPPGVAKLGSIAAIKAKYATVSAHVEACCANTNNPACKWVKFK